MEGYKYQRTFVENGLVELPKASETPAPQQQLVTVLNNIAYYGYALSDGAYDQLSTADESSLVSWWSCLESILKKLTGADKKMKDFVVYKNFPQEVLEMSQVEYWFKQVLMYWGFPNKYFTQDEKEREKLVEKLPVKVLRPACDTSRLDILHSLLKLPAKWTRDQWRSVKELATSSERPPDISPISFKENMVQLASFLIEIGCKVQVKTATDVLRLAVGMSDGDVSLRINSTLRKFSRPERKFLLSLLEGCRNLEEDAGRRREPFKRLFFALRPGDYKNRFSACVVAYDKLYRGARIATFNSEIERMFVEEDSDALNLLKTRPGEFMRRLCAALGKFGVQAADAFEQVLPRLTIHQLLKIQRHLLTTNDRFYRTFAPKGNWTKVQVVANDNVVDELLALTLADSITEEVSKRVSAEVPAVRLSPDAYKVKLQGNGSDLTPYGRGTVFDIPENITFLRTASYWKTGATIGNIWFDNGWNFFDDGWADVGSCCWLSSSYGDSAIFSGDPTNSKDLKGRACQMIDLYIDRLRERGVRYAVWNILCYSRMSFDEANDVHAALQWGEKPEANQVFEPSRCVFSFPIRGNSMTKYIAYIDLKERKLVYMDANLPGNITSAASNGDILAKNMPAFVEYLNSLPSVLDLFEGVRNIQDGMPIVYDDSQESIQGGQAYVFLPRNKQNEYKQFDLNSLLTK